ncbi:GLPGLI family protein [Pedobacter frigiditerrae]|uniref:GLPGLI family protein n=1 Tax=Pedobacter frigiditerrae TaxID=2530452 RepID=UPI0013F14DA7|nr:GLPGLI family protein [Pedobacter frigiditerrae]
MNKLMMLWLVFSLFHVKFTLAQDDNLITEGIIEFEKSANKFALIEKSLIKYNSNTMKEEFIKYKASHPQFLKLKSSLSFSSEKTLYMPSRNNESDLENRWNGKNIVSQINTVYNDFSTHTTITEKEIYGDFFLIKDSVRKITWKITDETREIAGYKCRRANGIIMDSIYVVAFYTSKIPIEGGPESFSGLPGMILGVALPHENTTWFATKVNIKPVILNDKHAPKKGVLTNYRKLFMKLKATFENDFRAGQDILKELML